MTTVAVIADELTAAGYRLAGARTFVAEGPEVASAFRLARESAQLVLLTPAAAAALPAAELEAALLEFEPLTLVIEDVLEAGAPPDLDHAMRVALGVETA
jgi:vacuolar-type H+-ATPase subunit F/Vma7